MATIPLPALSIKPPQTQNPLDEYARIVGIKSALQGQQLQGAQLQHAQQENQLTDLNLSDEKAWRGVMSNPNWDGTPDDLLKRGLQAGVGPKSYIGMQQNMIELKKKNADLDEVTLKNQQAQNDQYRGRLMSIINAPDEQKQALWDKEITAEENAKTIQPGSMTHTYPGDDVATTMANHFALGSVLAKEAIENKAAEARQQGADAAQQQADIAGERWATEKPAAQVKSQNAATDEQLAQQAKRSEIAKSAAETAKTKAETENLGQQPIFAVDPATNERVMTTRPEAQAKGYTNPVPVKEGDVSKETDARAMINDVQLNKSRYQSAMQRVYAEPMSAAQKSALVALTPEKLGVDFGSLLKLELPDVMQKVSNASAFSVLSPAQKQAVVGYYSTLASVPAAQKALTNIGRANKEMMDLELRTIPTPIMDGGTFNTMLDRFQGNIDQTSRKTVRMPGMPSTSDIRKLHEPQPQTNRPPTEFPSVPTTRSLLDMLAAPGSQQ